MLQDNERQELVKTGIPAWQVPRNLAVDNEILVPVNKVVHVLVTSSDVIHNWTIPSFGSKVDAVPGRVTATWFKADEGRRLLRPVLGAVRQGPRLHADRRARREGADVQRLGRGAEGAETRRRPRRSSAPSRSSSPIRPRSSATRPSEAASALPGQRRRGRVPDRRVCPKRRECGYEGRRHGKQGSRGPRARRRPRPQPLRLRAVALLHQPQGHRHDVPAVRHHGRADRRLPVGRHAHGAAGAGAAVLRQRPHVQRVRHRARPHHGVLHGDAGHDRRLRQLVRAAA